ncbi:hypothetical protein K439DRAFT_1295967, partial [Ramaria rubella]
VLHPKFKTAYFCHANWEPEWITDAQTMLHEEWEKNYKPKPAVSEPASLTSTAQASELHS